MTVKADDPSAADEGLERLQAAMGQEGLETERVPLPSFTVAVAASPGGAPLSRNILLPTAEVVAYLLPAGGTPFGNPADPFVGRNSATKASTHFNRFDRPEYSALILGPARPGEGGPSP